MRPRLLLYVFCFVLMIVCLRLPGQTASPGLALQFPGDIGIEKDSRVIFADNFEAGAIEDLKTRWNSLKDLKGGILQFTSDTPVPGVGRRSLQVTARLGEDVGGYLYKKLAPGFEKLHARFYVKFPEEAEYIHHFVALGGYNPPTDWPQGGAGEKPVGHDRIYIGIEPHGKYGRVPPPGAWNFYNYWHEMKISADGKYWGNAIDPETPLLVPRNRWQCVEVMARLNTAGQADGELALWLDGRPAMRIAKGTPRTRWTGMGFQLPSSGGEPFEGFNWRTDEKLKLNFFWLLHYVTEGPFRQNRVANPKRVNTVWFDNIVLAKEYIGPIRLDEK